MVLFSRVKSTSDERLLHRPEAQVTLPPAVEETEPLQKLYNLLEAKEFKTRMEGVALLLDLCKSSPQLVSTNTVQVCRVSSLFLSFSSFPKLVAGTLIQGVLALHPGCVGQAGASYPEIFNSGPWNSTLQDKLFSVQMYLSGRCLLMLFIR